MLREGGCPVICHHIAGAGEGDDDVVALHFDAQATKGSHATTVRAVAAVEASLAATVPAAAAVKSLPDRLYGR